MSENSKTNDLKITRVYNAPVKDVWRAWSDPEQAAKWWGPRGFTITNHSKDLRPGGHWHYTMHGPDGTDYPNKTAYIDVDEHKRLVYDHGANDNQPALFKVTALFSEIKDKTKMELTMTFASAETLERSKKIIKDADGNSTWDRLAEYLEKQASGKEIFVINRSFEVNIDTLFGAWTDPKQVIAWSGPIGAQMEYIRVDIKTGGKAFYRMPFGSSVIFGNVDYLEVSRPNRLVYTQQFAKEDGSPGRHPLAPTWPQSMLTTIIFSEEEGESTRITLAWEVTGEWNHEEMETFIKGKKGMSQGWGGSFNKLDEFLEGNRLI